MSNFIAIVFIYYAMMTVKWIGGAFGRRSRQAGSSMVFILLVIFIGTASGCQQLNLQLSAPATDHQVLVYFKEHLKNEQPLEIVRDSGLSALIISRSQWFSARTVRVMNLKDPRRYFKIVCKQFGVCISTLSNVICSNSTTILNQRYASIQLR